jgi:diguanylate cyclase (GGDEF)-like protein/PAS domain S-box-containing protein
VFTHAREGVMITAANGQIIDVNQSFSRITGYARDDVIGQTPRLFKSSRHAPEFYAELWQTLRDTDQWNGEIWNRRKNGEVYPETKNISAVRDKNGELLHYVALFSDITVFKQHAIELQHAAHYDALTGLPNRVLLAERLQQAMLHARVHAQRLAVAYLDLDGFKPINDGYGHAIGDQLLKELAGRMKQVLPAGDTFARLGGDEFVAVFVDADMSLVTQLLDAAALPVQIDDLSLRVSASLGVTFYPQTDDVGPDQLLRQADQAMYQAKLAGKNRHHVFDAEQDRTVRGHHESLGRIAVALAAGEFVLHYQPKVNMRTGVVIGAEALIRWRHPERGLLSPAAFLPAIENHSLAIDVGEWVIDTALVQIDLWRAAGLHLSISVNIGARQLQHADFVPRLRDILGNHPAIREGDLDMEVLETSALEDVVRVSEVIDACRKLGVSFSLDDFGTGYSSLTYLKRLPVAQLKIDQTFVRDMLDDPDDLAILEGIIGMATAFRRQVIAEGIETIAQGKMLLQLGCEHGQGFGIARPMPADAFAGWVQQWRPDPSWLNQGPVGRQDLPMLFAGVEHHAWLQAIVRYLHDGSNTLPVLDAGHCHFGQWIESEGKGRYGSSPAFMQLICLHEQMHVLAAQCCDPHASRHSSSSILQALGNMERQFKDALNLIGREASVTTSAN